MVEAGDVAVGEVEVRHVIAVDALLHAPLRSTLVSVRLVTASACRPALQAVLVPDCSPPQVPVGLVGSAPLTVPTLVNVILLRLMSRTLMKLPPRFVMF